MMMRTAHCLHTFASSDSFDFTPNTSKCPQPHRCMSSAEPSNNNLLNVWCDVCGINMLYIYIYAFNVHTSDMPRFRKILDKITPLAVLNLVSTLKMSTVWKNLSQGVKLLTNPILYFCFWFCLCFVLRPRARVLIFMEIACGNAGKPI